MNKTLKQLFEEYYELLNLGEIKEDQYDLVEWILDQCPNKNIKVIAEIYERTADRLVYILDNMTDDEILNCNQTIEDIIKDDIMNDDELSINIKETIFE